MSIPILTIWNLENNYVYYFQQSKETNKEGIPFVLLDHLDKYTMPDFEEDGAYTYKTDGMYRINYTIRSENSDYYYQFIQDNFQDSYYSLSVYEEKAMYFDFGSNFQLIEFYDFTEENNEESKKRLPITTERESEAREIINLLTKPLLKRVSPPLLNLQWLFDGVDYWKLERDWMWQWLE